MRKKLTGFTLLEILISLAIMAILAGSLYASLYVGFKARDTATRALEPAQRVSNVFTLLQQDFDGALPPTGTLAGEFVGTATNGVASTGSNTGTNSSASGSSGLGSSSSGSSGGLSAQSLNSSSDSLHTPSLDPNSMQLVSFYSSANNPPNTEIGGDIRKIELTLETPDGSKNTALMRRVYTNVLPSKEPTTRDQVLCRNVKNATLRYYDGTQWNDSWDSKALGDVLPSAIEVTLEFYPPENSTNTDSNSYTFIRIFKIPCGITADQAAEGSGN